MSNTNTLASTAPKRLTRSPERSMVAGVCGGIGVYLGVDPTVVRVLYALTTILTGIVPGVLAYFALMLLIPREQSAAVTQ